MLCIFDRGDVWGYWMEVGVCVGCVLCRVYRGVCGKGKRGRGAYRLVSVVMFVMGCEVRRVRLMGLIDEYKYDADDDVCVCVH